MFNFFEHFNIDKQQDELLNQISQSLEEDGTVSLVKHNQVYFSKTEDINFVNFDGKYSDVYFTNGEKITSSLVHFGFYDKLLNLGFVKMDKYTYVNFENILWYDMDYYRVYFTDRDYVQVAGAALRKYKVKLGRERDIRNTPSYNLREFRPIVT